MKKKLVSLAMAIVCATTCAFGLAACNGKDTLESVVFSNTSGMEIEVVHENFEAKSSEYNVMMSYGDDVGIDDITVRANHSLSGSTDLSLKTEDNPDGYEIEGTLPANPKVGTYTVNYLYEGWTIKINFVVNKKKVAWPDFESYYHDWTGDVVKPELLGDSEYITYNQNYGQTEIGKYSLEIDLKDDANCEWDAVYGDGNVITGTRVIEWEILKATYVVDNDLFLSGGTENENYAKCYEYVYDGTAKEFPINEEAIKDFKDKITIEIRNGAYQEVTEMKEVGIYYLFLKVNDIEHTRIKNKKESPDGWDNICVGQLRITESAT